MLKSDGWSRVGETVFTQAMLTRLSKKLVAGQDLPPDTTVPFNFDGHNWGLTVRSEPRCIEIVLMESLPVPESASAEGAPAPEAEPQAESAAPAEVTPAAEAESPAETAPRAEVAPAPEADPQAESPAPPEVAAKVEPAQTTVPDPSHAAGNPRQKRRTAKLGLTKKVAEADASALAQAMPVEIKKNPIKPVKLPSWVRAAKASEVPAPSENSAEPSHTTSATETASLSSNAIPESTEPSPEVASETPESVEASSEPVEANPVDQAATDSEVSEEAIEASPEAASDSPEPAKVTAEPVEANPVDPAASDSGVSEEAIEASPEAASDTPSEPAEVRAEAETVESPSVVEAATDSAVSEEAIEVSPEAASDTPSEPAEVRADSETVESPPEAENNPTQPDVSGGPEPPQKALSEGLELLLQPLLDSSQNSDLRLPPPAVMASVEAPPARDWILELPIEGIELETTPPTPVSRDLQPAPTASPDLQPPDQTRGDEIEAPFEIPLEEVPPLTETLAALGLDLDAESPAAAAPTPVPAPKPPPEPETQPVNPLMNTLAEFQTLTAGRPGTELAFPSGRFPLITLGNLPISIGSAVLSQEDAEQINLLRPLELEPHNLVHSHWKLENGYLVADSPLLPECKLKTPAAEVLAERPGQLVVRRENILLYVDPNGKMWELESNAEQGLRRPQVQIRGSWVWVLSRVARPKRWLNLGKPHEVQLIRYSILGGKAVGARFGKFHDLPVWGLSPNGVYCGWLSPLKNGWRLEIINSLEEQIEGHFDLPSSALHPEELVLSDEGDFALQVAGQVIWGERTPKEYRTSQFTLSPLMKLESVNSSFGVLARSEARFQHHPPLTRDWSPLPPSRQQLEQLAKTQTVVQAQAQGPVVYWDQTWKAAPLQSRHPGDWKNLIQQFDSQAPVSLVEIDGEMRFLEKLPTGIQFSRFRAIQVQGKWRVVAAENCPPAALTS